VPKNPPKKSLPLAGIRRQKMHLEECSEVFKNFFQRENNLEESKEKHVQIQQINQQNQTNGLVTNRPMVSAGEILSQNQNKKTDP
jgi:hypothetical protein